MRTLTDNREQGRSGAVEVIDRLLARAVELGASDLHLEPGEHGVEVRVRCDGALRRLELLSLDLHASLVGRLKALAELLVYRVDVPQEGRIQASQCGLPCGEIRISTYPVLNGERVALRFESGAGTIPVLGELGLEAEIAAQLRRAVEQPEGLVLLTGPSGSGKTTTLYACLQHLAGAHGLRSVVTVEDPVERRIPGITQTEINRASGLDFPQALKSLLRQDPDALLIGEIRDRETAAIAVEAALTGHWVASTVHAGTATLVFARLLEMGVEPFALTTVVRGVLAQRLLRRSCSDCRGLEPARGSCATCDATGYRGRCLVAEWLPMSGSVREAVLQRADGECLAHAARETESTPLVEHARRCVANGITDEQEYRRVFGDVH